MIPYLQAEHLTKSVGDRVLFTDISFSIGEGQRVALIARNGTGKTTLLNILSGNLAYDSGNVITRRDLRVGYLPQHPSLSLGMSVLEACLNCDNAAIRTIMSYEKALLSGNEEQMALAGAEMDAHKAWNYEARIKQILGMLKITKLNQPVETLSGGQLKRVALANVLISEPELLLLDEPTNHLDLEMIEWLEKFLKQSGMALLMVTHDRYFLDNVCSDIIELDNQRLYSYHGNYAYYLEQHSQREATDSAENSRLQNLYRRELDWMRRMPQARGHKSKDRIDNFHKLEQRLSGYAQNKDISLQVKSEYIGSKIFEARYVSKSFGELRILDNFYYNFSRYEKLGIVGKNGTGKSTFLKMLLGIEKPDSGSFDIGQTVRFGYYRQEGIKFDEQMKVLDVVRDIAEEIDLGGGRKLSASQFLQHFCFAPSQQHNYVYKLSGGERQRLHLCQVLMSNPNFLVLDEPTNDLDIATLNILEDYLINFKGCVIVVSHDRYFMDKVVDHLFVFEGDGIVKDFPGNYTQFREYSESQRRSETNATILPKTEKRQKTANTDNNIKKKLTYNQQQELKALEMEIPELEERKRQLETMLSGAILTPEQIRQVSADYNCVSAELDAKELRWLELSE